MQSPRTRVGFFGNGCDLAASWVLTFPRSLPVGPSQTPDGTEPLRVQEASTGSFRWGGPCGQGALCLQPMCPTGCSGGNHWLYSVGPRAVVSLWTQARSPDWLQGTCPRGMADVAQPCGEAYRRVSGGTQAPTPRIGSPRETRRVLYLGCSVTRSC